MLNDYASSPRPARGLWLAGACVVVLATPLSLVARQDDIPPPPAPPAPPAAAAPFAPPAPPAMPRPARLAALPLPPAPPAAPAPPRIGPLGGIAGGIPGGVPGGIDDDQAPPPPPPPPPAPRGTAPPPPPPPPPPPADWAWSTGNGETFVLADGKGFSSSTFSGSRHDMEEARRLRATSDGPFLYYRVDGQAYVSRDRALIDRVKAEMKAQHDVGAEQAALGARQAALGEEQAKLGSRQGAMAARHHEYATAMAGQHIAHSQIGALQGALAALEMQTEAQSAEIVAARKAVREAIASLERSQKNAIAQERDRQSRAKGDRMREVSDMQRDLGQQQATLGAKQAELGRMQAELGARQHAAWAAARKRIRVILEEARAKGQVESVK